MEQKLNDHPDRWLSLLSPFGGQAEERRGWSAGGQEPPGFQERNKCLSLKHSSPQWVELRMSNCAFTSDDYWKAHLLTKNSIL